MTREVIAESLATTLNDLEERVAVLEQRHKLSASKGPSQALDAFSTRMLVSALAAGFTQTLFVRCRDDYYERPLEHRRQFLNAASTHHLTKSIVMQNTRHTGEDSDDVLRSKYVCVVVPYTAKINSDILRDAIRKLYAERGENVPGVKQFNYRLAEDCVGITGYEPNGVTPLNLKTKMPVVVAKQISTLKPGVFWLGGGEVSLKWRVRWDEFEKVFNPTVLDFAVSNGE